MPIIKNTKLGNQTATKGDRIPLTEKVVVMVENNIYKELKASPTPKCKPIPPRTLREESDTPISVIIKAASGIENRL